MIVKLIFGIIFLTFLAVIIGLWPLIKKSAWWCASILLVALPLMALALYFHWGKPRELLDYSARQQQAALVNNELAKIKNPQQVVDRLVAYLRQHPEQAKGWYLLGRLYLTTENYEAAVDALQRAYMLSKDNNDYATTYAEALFFNHHRQLTIESKNILLQVLQRSPNNINANNLLAIDAYNQGNYTLAIQYWEKLIPFFNPQSQDEKALLEMIGRAQKQLAK